MNFFKLILILCMSIYINDAKIYLYGETHGETANNIRKESWKKYRNGEIEFLSEGSPYNPLKSQEEYDNEDKFMIDNQEKFMIDNLDLLEFHINFTKCQILFAIATATSEKDYQDYKKHLRNVQKSNYDNPLVELPDHYTAGIKKAKELFYKHWEFFTNTTADGLWRDFKIDLEKDKLDNLKILQKFDWILYQFRNLHMAQVIAKKYRYAENPKKDLYVYLGNNHRDPVEKLLQTLHKILKENIHSEYLEKTEHDNPFLL